MKHTVIRSKMKKTKPLMNDRFILRHVPKTDWFHASSLRKMLPKYNSLYIKPDKGSRGSGVIRVRKLNGSQSEISYRKSTRKCSTKKVFSEVKKILHPKRKYIIQQGINLATYHRRPFDVRVVLQKPLNRWKLTWMSARVAPKKTSVVTNIAKGAKDVTLNKTLLSVDQPLNRLKVLQDLIDVSYQIAQKLDSKFPLKIVGLDMGIDKKGKIWFIEANTRPDFSGLRKLDSRQYQKYLEAKKLTRKR